MNIADPTYLEHLRDLPSSYLLDLMVDCEGIDLESIYWVLQERGLSRQGIDQKLQRRRSSRWPRPYTLWKVARWLTLFHTLVVVYFNTTGFYRLAQGDHAFKGPLLFLAVGCIIVGFLIGYKMTTHLYHGSRFLLYCGFPVPVGFVELQSGRETLKSKTSMILCMAMNALVGISLALFPLIFIYIMME